jgi:acyl-coenzyme A thioesterase PaaI-like protein
MRRQPTSNHCFICGRQNPVGLKMEFHSAGSGEVVAEYTVPDVYQGYPGVVHGGVTAAILDETAGRSVMTDDDEQRFFVTLKLETRYRRQVPTGTPLRILGHLKDLRGRRAVVHSEIRLPDGTVAAEAEAVLVELQPHMLQAVDTEALGWGVRDT